jgi:hypothetical protein
VEDCHLFPEFFCYQYLCDEVRVIRLRVCNRINNNDCARICDNASQIIQIGRILLIAHCLKYI